jgi:hypothetical protein
MTVSLRAAGTLLLTIAFGLTLAMGSSEADTQPSPASVIDLLFSVNEPVYAAAVTKAEQADEADRAEFNSAAAKQEREDSQGEFADVSDTRAVKIARASFPDELTGPTEAGLDSLTNGLHIANYTGEFSAQVETATGQPYGVMESSAPLTTDTSADTPVDLSLERHGDDYLPADSGTDVELPTNATSPATLVDAGISLKPIGADSTPSVERSDRLLYPSIDTDTDYVLQPTERGVESWWQLRSPDSPETLKLQYDLPGGAHLEDHATAGGPGSVAIVNGDQTLGVVAPVSAVDAAQRPVPTSMTVDGDNLVISVDHRTDDVQYPVLVDPITESWTGSQWNNCGSGSAGGAWSLYGYWGVPNSNYFNLSCNSSNYGGYGVWVGSWPGQTYIAGAEATMGYHARPNTYISDVTWGGYRHYNVYGSTAGIGGATSFVGLAGDHAPTWQQLVFDNYGRNPADYSQHNDDPTNNWALTGLLFQNQATSQGAWMGVNWVAMYIRDGQAPDIPTVSAPTATLTNGEYFYPWSSATPTMSASATDIGLGIWDISVIKDDGSIMWGPYWFTSTGITATAPSSGTCGGTRANPCPINASTSQLPFKNLVEGDNTGRVAAQDAGMRVTYGPRVHVQYSPIAGQRPRTTVPFNAGYSVGAVQGALLQVRDIGQLLVPDGGLALGSDQTVPEALGELQSEYPEDHAGVSATVTGVVLNAPVVTSAVATALAPFTGGSTSDSIYDDSQESQFRDAYFANLGAEEPAPRSLSSVRQDHPWLPSIGSVSAFTDASKTLSSRVINHFQFPSGSLAYFNRVNNWDYSYEHDFKETHSGLLGHQPGCQNEEKYYWARRGHGMMWNTDLPSSSKPYFDTQLQDPCAVMDLTIGIKNVQQLSETRVYTTRVFSAPGEVGSNPYQLQAQRIVRRGCPSAKVCGFTEDLLNLVGPTKGIVPGCRTWAVGENSLPC